MRTIRVRLTEDEFHLLAGRAEDRGNTVAGQIRATIHEQVITAELLRAAERRIYDRLGTAIESIPEAIERRLYARLAELFTAPQEPRP